jgi:hypothetical protein
VALVPPDLSDFANSTKRCMKRKATDFMSGMQSRRPATTRLHIDLLFCGDYQFAMHRLLVSNKGMSAFFRSLLWRSTQKWCLYWAIRSAFVTFRKKHS